MSKKEFDENMKLGAIQSQPTAHLSGYEVKLHGVTIQHGVHSLPMNASSDVMRNLEVYQLQGDKKWKI